MGTTASEDGLPDDGPDPEASVMDSVFVAIGIGLVGPLLQIVVALGVIAVDQVVVLPPLVALAAAIVLGQYVGFVGWALAYLRSRGLDWAGVRSYLGVRVPTLRELGIVIGGWALIFGSLLVVVWVVVQAAGAQPAENQTQQLVENLPVLIPPLIVIMFLVVGPAEEILYRGVVQGRLRERFGAPTAILLASAIFAVVHWVALTGGASARLTTIAILLVPSVVLGAVYEYTGNLVVPALIHGLHNSVLLALFYLSMQVQAPNGLLVPLASLA